MRFTRVIAFFSRLKGIEHLFNVVVGAIPAMLNATALLLGLVNLAIGGDANYAFVCAAPDVDHPLIQGDWPWYMLVLEVVGLLLFAVAYLPFYLSDILRRKRKGVDTG